MDLNYLQISDYQYLIRMFQKKQAKTLQGRLDGKKLHLFITDGAWLPSLVYTLLVSDMLQLGKHLPGSWQLFTKKF